MVIEDKDVPAIDWECGSCGAVIDNEMAEPGEPYHFPDEDCRSVRAYKEG